MATIVAEYLGRRTDVGEQISPVVLKTNVECPFKNRGYCTKVQKGYEPVCSVRRVSTKRNRLPIENEKELWIVCPDRLCSTKKDLLLCDHQKKMLADIASYVFVGHNGPKEVCVKREVDLNVFGSTAKESYHADYIMAAADTHIRTPGPNKLVLEMQGGGETSGTEELTKVVKEWRKNPDELGLLTKSSSANPLPANAWRRQQEQFLVKGDVAMKTWRGLGIAFCVGTILFDYIMRKVNVGTIPNLRGHCWTLCLMGIKEDKSEDPVPGPIPLKVDESRILYTNYQSFVQALINRGEPTTDAFIGEFLNLDNEDVLIDF